MSGTRIQRHGPERFKASVPDFSKSGSGAGYHVLQFSFGRDYNIKFSLPHLDLFNVRNLVSVGVKIEGKRDSRFPNKEITFLCTMGVIRRFNETHQLYTALQKQLPELTKKFPNYNKYREELIAYIRNDMIVLLLAILDSTEGSPSPEQQSVFKSVNSISLGALRNLRRAIPLEDQSNIIGALLLSRNRILSSIGFSSLDNIVALGLQDTLEKIVRDPSYCREYRALAFGHLLPGRKKVLARH